MLVCILPITMYFCTELKGHLIKNVAFPSIPCTRIDT